MKQKFGCHEKCIQKWIGIKLHRKTTSKLILVQLNRINDCVRVNKFLAPFASGNTINKRLPLYECNWSVVHSCVTSASSSSELDETQICNKKSYMLSTRTSLCLTIFKVWLYAYQVWNGRCVERCMGERASVFMAECWCGLYMCVNIVCNHWLCITDCQQQMCYSRFSNDAVCCAYVRHCRCHCCCCCCCCVCKRVYICVFILYNILYCIPNDGVPLLLLYQHIRSDTCTHTVLASITYQRGGLAVQSTPIVVENRERYPAK